MGSGRMTGGFDGWLGSSPGGAGSGGGGGGKTLAAIYAFGLSDDPTVDNIFGMPSGNLRFPGTSPFTANTYDVGFFGGLALDAYSAGSAYNYVRKAANLGLGTTGVTFNDYCFNDTAWNTNPATISGANWIIEQITLNNATTDDRAGFATYAERRYLFSSTGRPFRCREDSEPTTVCCTRCICGIRFTVSQRPFAPTSLVKLCRWSCPTSMRP